MQHKGKLKSFNRRFSNCRCFLCTILHPSFNEDVAIHSPYYVLHSLSFLKARLWLEDFSLFLPRMHENEIPWCSPYRWENYVVFQTFFQETSWKFINGEFGEWNVQNYTVVNLTKIIFFSALSFKYLTCFLMPVLDYLLPLHLFIGPLYVNNSPGILTIINALHGFGRIFWIMKNCF